MKFRCEWVAPVDAQLAFEIRRRVYTDEFGFDLGGAGPTDTIDQRAHHLVVKTPAGEPVASLRLVDASNRPFEIERFLDIDPILPPGARPAEITRLCILSQYRRITQASFVHLAMLEAVLRLTTQLHVTHIVASTRKELMAFYQYLLFEPYAAITYEHPEIGNAPHTLMSLDLGTFPERCRRLRPTLAPAVDAALGSTRSAGGGT